MSIANFLHELVSGTDRYTDCMSPQVTANYHVCVEDVCLFIYLGKYKILYIDRYGVTFALINFTDFITVQAI